MINKMSESPWDNSIKVDKPLVERRTRENFRLDSSLEKFRNYNYRAESIDCLKRKNDNDKIIFKQTQEIPNNIKLIDATPWNFETSYNHKKMDKLNNEKTQRALTSCVSKRSLIKNYTSLIDSSLNKTQTMRKLLLPQPESPEETEIHIPKYNTRSSTNTYTYTKHSGVWEFNPIAGRMMWSDTGSFVYDSPGDIVLRHDPGAHSFAGPTLSTTCRPSHTGTHR